MTDRLTKRDSGSRSFVTEDVCSCQTIKKDGVLVDVFFGDAIDRLSAFEDSEDDLDNAELDRIRRMIPSAHVYHDSVSCEYIIRIDARRMVEALRLKQSASVWIPDDRD